MVNIFPESLYQRLEFDKVLALLAGHALGQKGRAAIANLPILDESSPIALLLAETGEMQASMANGTPIPVAIYPELDEICRFLAIEDYVLGTQDFVQLRQVLVATFEAARFITGKQKDLPNINLIVQAVDLQDHLLSAINKVFDTKGELKPDASAELMRVRKRIQSRSNDLDLEFRKVLNHFKSQGLLSEQGESVRNGRRVLSIPVENRKRVGGIVHDESATGKTIFVEPEAIVVINNELFELYAEERREIYKIMQTLSKVFHPYAEHMLAYELFLARLDLIQAKAKLSISFDGVMPEILSVPYFGLKKAYHPLLFLRNKIQEKPTIPFDLELLHQNRILLLSGPNAGGKSITMKAVGLLQLMFQAGIPIPVDKSSKLGIFKQIFADIGDQQSLEEDLSTYSSHLRNMRHFIDESDAETLVLIDEFGAGTDPQIGGAIAEGVLQYLNLKQVYGVINTHYSNLKIFAHKTKGIVNGSMFFDKEELHPTYEMKIGTPGSSFAFEIANQVGLHKQVLKHARYKTGKNERAIDELLAELQQEKRLLEDQLTSVNDKEKSLDRLIRNYEHMQREFEMKRKKLRLDIKAQQSVKVMHEHKELEKALHEIKSTLNLEKAKALAVAKKVERDKMAIEQQEIQQEINQIQKGNIKANNQVIAVGSFVRMRNSGATGQVDSIIKGKAIVSMGLMRMTLPLIDLEIVGEQLEINSQRRIQLDVISNSAS
ncbi:MAG: MutS2/Smr-associated SH3 domain-containing protein, partial [Saprospiraceae bacterium]